MATFSIVSPIDHSLYLIIELVCQSRHAHLEYISNTIWKNWLLVIQMVGAGGS